jgi:predicted nucleic acid-binding protein
MIYFDTDVLINYLLIQDETKNKIAIRHYHAASADNAFFCSLLCIQEAAFVLSRLKVSIADTEEMISSLMKPEIVNYTLAHYNRAVELARILGYQNINDCLHTAIAESYCTELYTFNHSDFKKLQKLTDLKITLL